MPQRVVIVIIEGAVAGCCWLLPVGFLLLALVADKCKPSFGCTIAQLVVALTLGVPFLVIVTALLMLLKWPLIITAAIVWAVWACLQYLFRAVLYTLEWIGETTEGVVSWFFKP